MCSNNNNSAITSRKRGRRDELGPSGHGRVEPCKLQIGYVNNTKNMLLKYVRKVHHGDGGFTWDMTGCLSPECFEEWLSNRRNEPKRVEVAFKDAVFACFRGNDSRKVFPEDMQRALVKLVRRREVWPCFKGRVDKEGNPIRIGQHGFRGRACFERRDRTSSSRTPRSLGDGTGWDETSRPKRRRTEEDALDVVRLIAILNDDDDSGGGGGNGGGGDDESYSTCETPASFEAEADDADADLDELLNLLL